MPLFDRAISDWYRTATGIRGVAGWPSLVGALHHDLDQASNRQVLADLQSELTHGTRYNRPVGNASGGHRDLDDERQVMSTSTQVFDQL